jgi:hypothetical protein
MDISYMYILTRVFTVYFVALDVWSPFQSRGVFLLCVNLVMADGIEQCIC